MIQIFGQATPNKNILQESDFNDLIFNVELNKANIYDKAILWFAENFKSSKAVIEIQDKQAGKIIGNGSFTIPWVFFEATTTFTISIDIKDGKYKVKYSNLILDYGQAKVSVIEEKFNITEDIWIFQLILPPIPETFCHFS
jgi:hypothetical protein